VLQCVAVCCSVFSQLMVYGVSVCGQLMFYGELRLRGAVCCSVLQCVAVCCSVLQCGAVYVVN